MHALWYASNFSSNISAILLLNQVFCSMESSNKTYTTKGGVQITFQQEFLPLESAIPSLIDKLDTHRGAIFSSGYEFPGRYTRWDKGFCNPPLAIICQGYQLSLEALNGRGEILLAMLMTRLEKLAIFDIQEQSASVCRGQIKAAQDVFIEEERSHQPSVFSLLRMILDFFHAEEEPWLGIYGAFGYDLIFQFEDLEKLQTRTDSQREMVLYIPDEIIIVNRSRAEAFKRSYDFKFDTWNTASLPRDGASHPVPSARQPDIASDHAPGEYQAAVERAKAKFTCGDLFELVLSQTFYHPGKEKPSSLFRRMCAVNPSPYGFFINLGEGEYLVGASPEMYVRVQGRKVESCPVSGTVARGADAIEDAENIQSLLDSPKERAELTMCTDVDRNDKSRICEPGSVLVRGRRQIELYSRVIHTVDHVEGTLREGFDAVDAFLTHMWVVTVTGAPKIWAMKAIEAEEKSARRWYGGAVGWFGFDGNLNTGLVLRTIHLDKGLAGIRVGATLLFDSDPEMEARETELKASAFIDLLLHPDKPAPKVPQLPREGLGKQILLVDHQDSFVHTLGNYFRQTGATVTTVRHHLAKNYLQKNHYDLVVLSPGPGEPSDFFLHATIDAILEKKIPLFGVCLGLQGIVEYFGGTLSTLEYPMHGKASSIQILDNPGLFDGLDTNFTAGRYHSLHANPNFMPEVLKVTALSEDGIIMAISHRELPIHALQFHPETILSLPGKAGLRIVNNMMRMLKRGSSPDIS